jgi:hypothetical protein
MAKVKYKFNTKSLTYEKVTPNFNWQKITLKLIIFLAIAYFVIGYLLVLVKWFDQTQYLAIAGVVGGIASVAGLLTFLSSKLSKDDVEKIGVEYFKQVVDAADKLNEKEKTLLDKEKQLSNKEREIKQLELKKAELEFVVKKASMTIFLKDQLHRVENRIVEVIQDHKELSGNIEQREGIIRQLDELQEEIEKSDNTKLVEDVIYMVSKDKDNAPKDYTFLDFLLKVLN